MNEKIAFICIFCLMVTLAIGAMFSPQSDFYVPDKCKICGAKIGSEIIT